MISQSKFHRSPNPIQDRSDIRLILYRRLGHDVVHVIVGTESKDFGIHKDLICYYSPYFNAAFTSGFEETRTLVMKIPETRVNVFQLFFDWLYTQVINIRDTDRKPSTNDLAELYIFADMAQIPSLMNRSLEAFHLLCKEHRKFPSPDQVRQIWDRTPSNSQLRQYLVDGLAWFANPEDFYLSFEGYPEDVRHALVQEMRKIIDDLRVAAPLIKKTRPPDNIKNYFVDEKNLPK
jgi:hypothetical protein